MFKNNFFMLHNLKMCRCLQQIVVRQYRYVNTGNTGTSTLNKMYATDLIHAACVKLNANVNFQQVALELSVDSEYLLSGRLFLHIYVFNDIWWRLYITKIMVPIIGPEGQFARKP